MPTKSCLSCSTSNRSIGHYCKKCGARLSADNSEGVDDLIGLEDVKEFVKNFVAVMAAVKYDGLSYSNRLHTIIMGNSGTG